MKTINVLLLFAIIFAVNSELSGFEKQTCLGHAPAAVSSYISGGGDKQAYSLDFCRSTEYDDYDRCCFLKYEDSNERRQYHCLPLTSNQFWNIDDTIERIEAALGSNIEIDSLDCSSSYLFVSLLLIFALLF